MLIRNLVLAALAVAALVAAAAPSEARVLRVNGRYVWVNPNVSALNPQPLPPRWTLGNRWGAVALNPQPLPPRWTLGNRWGAVALNPQPLPPRYVPRYRYRYR